MRTAQASTPQYSAPTFAVTVVTVRSSSPRALFSRLTSIKSATTPTTSTCTALQAYSLLSSIQTTSPFLCHTLPHPSNSSIPLSTSILPTNTTHTNTPSLPATTSVSTSPLTPTPMPVSPHLPLSSTFLTSRIAGSLTMSANLPIPPPRARLLQCSQTQISDRRPPNAIPHPPSPHNRPLHRHSPLLRGVKAPTWSLPVVNGKHPRLLLTRLFTCLRSRARKIRCDSTRPICHNCVRRSNECQYDAVPKRRGPDKRPGTRQRSCKKRSADGSAPPVPPSKRKRTSRVPDPQEATEDRKPLDPPTLRTSDLEQDGHIRLDQPSLSPQGSEFSSSAPSRGLSSADSYSTVCTDQEFQSTRSTSLRPCSQHSDRRLLDKVRIPATPSLQYNRKEWWDNLVNSYSTTRDQSYVHHFSVGTFLNTSAIQHQGHRLRPVYPVRLVRILPTPP